MISCLGPIGDLTPGTIGPEFVPLKIYKTLLTPRGTLLGPYRRYFDIMLDYVYVFTFLKNMAPCDGHVRRPRALAPCAGHVRRPRANKILSLLHTMVRIRNFRAQRHLRAKCLERRAVRYPIDRRRGPEAHLLLQFLLASGPQ